MPKKEEEREEWDRPMEFFLSLIGCSIGEFRVGLSRKDDHLSLDKVLAMSGDIPTLVSEHSESEGGHRDRLV